MEAKKINYFRSSNDKKIKLFLKEIFKKTRGRGIKTRENICVILFTQRHNL